MKKSIIVFILLYTICSGQTIPQSTYRNSSLDIVTDIAGIAMGESFVANTKSASSFFENPSALPYDKSTRFFYNYRSNGWNNIADNMKFFSFGVTTSNNIGNFGISYNQYSSGDIEVSSGPPVQSMNEANRLYIFSFSRDIVSGFTLGLSAKLFNRSIKSKGYDYNLTSNNSLLCDVGLLYQRKGFLDKSTASDNISAGLSIQNFGTDFSTETTTIFTEKANVRLPRYLRVGFAYEMKTIVGRTNTNIDFLLTGEYKSLLNPTDLERTNVDYWGAGLEATLFKILSIRIGSLSAPEYNILYDRAKFKLRYGVGMTFPLATIGFSYPMYLKFDFASIPINHVAFEGAKNSLYGFAVSLIFNPNN
jgi:hypothetical protein